MTDVPDELGDSNHIGRRAFLAASATAAVLAGSRTGFAQNQPTAASAPASPRAARGPTGPTGW